MLGNGLSIWGLRFEFDSANKILMTKFSMSGEWVRQLAQRQPALHGESCRRFFVMPSPTGFGLARMFQIVGEPHYAITIVLSLDEILATLTVEPPRFESLETISNPVTSALLGTISAFFSRVSHRWHPSSHLHLS